MIRLILSIFIPFRWFIEKSGADYNQFLQILKFKLTIDNRSSKTLTGKKDNALLMQSITLIFIGILFSAILTKIQSPFTFYYLVHSFIMVMMATMIISEFSTLLFDTSENAIIQPLPVNGNTINLARNAHICIYLTLSAFNLSFISIIIAFIKFGPGSGITFIFSIILNVIMTLFISNILYLGIMRLATGEKLKNFLMYFQIGIAILFMAGYQFGLKLINASSIQDMTIAVNWYTYLIPPAFFAGLVDTLTSTDFSLSNLGFSIEALIFPFAGIFLTGRYLTPEFNKRLLDLEQGERNSKVISEFSGKSLWYRLMLQLFVLNADEKAAFKLMWQMIGRERLFKQILFPSFGYTLILLALPFFNGEGFQKLALSEKYLLFLYSFSIVGASIPTALMAGSNKHAAWIFKSIPLGKPSILFKGCIKAAFARYFIPIYICLGIGICSIWGIRVFPDVLIAFLAIYLLTLTIYYYQRHYFPFAIEKNAISGNGYFTGLLAMVVLVAYGFLHLFLIHLHSFANLLLIPLNFGLIFLLNRVMVYRIITWKSVDSVNIY